MSNRDLNGCLSLFFDPEEGFLDSSEEMDLLNGANWHVDNGSAPGPMSNLGVRPFESEHVIGFRAGVSVRNIEAVSDGSDDFLGSADELPTLKEVEAMKEIYAAKIRKISS